MGNSLGQQLRQLPEHSLSLAGGEFDHTIVPAGRPALVSIPHSVGKGGTQDELWSLLAQGIQKEQSGRIPKVESRSTTC